jgi:hypothetical protein
LVQNPNGNNRGKIPPDAQPNRAANEVKFELYIRNGIAESGSNMTRRILVLLEADKEF